MSESKESTLRAEQNVRDNEKIAAIAAMLKGMNTTEAACVVCGALNDLFTVDRGLLARVEYLPVAKYKGLE
jgi:hypothetical protein